MEKQESEQILESMRSDQQDDLIDRTSEAKIPNLGAYIAAKLQKNGSGGRPHFVALLKKNNLDPKEELLNIFEAAWIKNRPIRNIAKDYKSIGGKAKSKYLTIARILQDCESFKTEIITYLTSTPRAKKFFNRELEISDYECVQNYINRAKRDKLKTWKRSLITSENCWRFLNYRDPATWTADEVSSYLDTLTYGAAAHLVARLRLIAPQLREKGGAQELKSGRFTIKLQRRKKDIFAAEIRLIIEAIKAKLSTFELMIFLLHIAIGAREGSHGVDPRSGITGLTWDRFHGNFTLCDDYESKVRGGIWWRDCPTNLLFPELPELLRQTWIARKKPITTNVIEGGYDELRSIWKAINRACAEYYEGKLDPALYKEITTIRPHDADKIHVNLLWEAGARLEVVAGQYEGGSDGIGLVGRGWLNVEVIRKYYLSLTRRSKRFQKMYARIQHYATQFGGQPETPEEKLPIVESIPLDSGHGDDLDQ